jgi:uncharacterized protein (DUF2236 family)
MLFGWSRAILLQFAHPLIAAGVAEHSTFRGGPLVAVTRLHHTVRAMLSLTFGDDTAREQTLAGIRAIHRRVHGRLAHDVGIFRAGTPYSAEDPALVLWVHATLMDSILLVYERLVAPLTAAERDAFCSEAALVPVALGAPEADVPTTFTAIGDYMEATMRTGAIVVGPQARELADAVLAPSIAVLVWPATRVNRLISVGLLPAAIRDQYGFAWSARDERRLEWMLRLLRKMRRAMPERLALWPEARAVNLG